MYTIIEPFAFYGNLLWNASSKVMQISNCFLCAFPRFTIFFIIYCYVAFFSLGGEESRFTIHVNGTITLHALKTIISPPIYFSRPSTLVTRLLYITFSLLNRTLEIYRIVIIYFSHFRKREIHSRDYSFRKE